MQLRGNPDLEIWRAAKARGFTIVSKDTDFRERAFVEGVPPKIIRLDIGNGGTEVVIDLLRREHHRIASFDHDVNASVLTLSNRL